jgi:hypothetical protein
MNSQKQSKLKMYLTLRIYLLSSPAITAKLPNFPEFLAALDAAIAQIQTNSEQHQLNTKGVTTNKQLLRDTVVTDTVDASSKMQAYANYTHNEVLLAEIKFKHNDLKDIPALDLKDIANIVYHRINDYSDLVSTYGFSEETQKTYRADIDAFSDSIPQPRQSMLKGEENTLLVNQGFVMGDEAVGNIDGVVEIVRLTESLFYAGYKNARKIVEQGIGSLQVQGNITDASTGNPLPGATITFRLSGQTEVAIEKEAALKGGFMIKSLAEGIYDVTITKIGFKNQVLSVVVDNNELCNLDVAMVKL